MTTNLLWVYVVWTIVIKYSDFCLVELIRCGLSRDSGEEKSQLIFNLPLDYSQFNKSLSENKSELSRYIKWQRERRYCAFIYWCFTGCKSMWCITIELCKDNLWKSFENHA